jgi:hypothetical protein
MSRYGQPATPRSCLDRGTRSATNDIEMQRLRAAAWHQQGVASLAIEDIADPWLRQALINEANRRWGRRNGGSSHGR